MAAKCGNGAGTLKQDVQTFMMQAVKEESKYQLILFSKWIRRFEKIVGSQFLCLAQTSVKNWLKAQVAGFYDEGIGKLVQRCEKCLLEW